MREFEIDRAMGKLIAINIKNGGWTPQEETAFHNLSAQRSRLMRPKRRHRP